MGKRLKYKQIRPNDEYNFEHNLSLLRQLLSRADSFLELLTAKHKALEDKLKKYENKEK